MTLQHIYHSIKARLPLSMQFLIEVLSYWRRLCRYNASISTNKDMQKMQYTLLRKNHIIEKGMSMRKTRRGFGQEKVSALIKDLRIYNNKYGAGHPTPNTFLIYPLSTIKTYIAYQQHEGVDVDNIEKDFLLLCSEAAITPESLSAPAGVETMQAAQLKNGARSDFKSLLYSRHSIRYFKDQQPSRELLDEALLLASRTPSACNRQAWHTHIYFGDDAHELLRMQSGCNGFCDDIPCCIVVTADMKGFLGHEPFQCYIDGGLYAQNLINALHYVGLGNIPLSCGFMSDQLLAIQKRFNIPENEVMIVIIGTGIMFDEMKIAVSTRRSISSTNNYHLTNPA
jgi:hypothetical protein